MQCDCIIIVRGRGHRVCHPCMALAIAKVYRSPFSTCCIECRGLISCTYSITSRTIRPCPSRRKMSRWNTLAQWRYGQLLVWDADTYAPSYAAIAGKRAGAVANQAEHKKSTHSNKQKTANKELVIEHLLHTDTARLFTVCVYSFYLDVDA